MATYKLTIQYEGTRYKGWQRLRDDSQTVQGKIEQILSRHFEMPIEIHGSGRTDAGVHALGQVAHFKAPAEIELVAFLKTINAYLPQDIVISKVEAVDDRFHARFHAQSKTYLYRLWTASYRPVIERQYVWDYSEGPALDIVAMREVAAFFLGTHDFKGFSSDRTKKSSIRSLAALEISEIGNEIQFRLTADGFLYNMVRIIVGTLIAAGQHKIGTSNIEAIFAGAPRSEAGETAPAQGLVLLKVDY